MNSLIQLSPCTPPSNSIDSTKLLQKGSKTKKTATIKTHNTHKDTMATSSSEDELPLAKLKKRRVSTAPSPSKRPQRSSTKRKQSLKEESEEDVESDDDGQEDGSDEEEKPASTRHSPRKKRRKLPSSSATTKKSRRGPATERTCLYCKKVISTKAGLKYHLGE
jgi:hypothetical protein